MQAPTEKRTAMVMIISGESSATTEQRLKPETRPRRWMDAASRPNACPGLSKLRVSEHATTTSRTAKVACWTGQSTNLPAANELDDPDLFPANFFFFFFFFFLGGRFVVPANTFSMFIYISLLGRCPYVSVPISSSLCFSLSLSRYFSISVSLSLLFITVMVDWA